MEADLKPHQIIERLNAAFATVPYPGDNHLLVQRCPAGLRLCDGLRGRPPGAVPDDFVARHHDGLSLLSSEARRHYLPAWARTALRRPGSEVAEFVLHALAGDLRWQLEGGFTTAQRGAIADFLDFLPRCLDRIFHPQIADAQARWRSLVPLRRLPWPSSYGPMMGLRWHEVPDHLESLELPVHTEQLERLERRGGMSPGFRRVFG